MTNNITLNYSKEAKALGLFTHTNVESVTIPLKEFTIIQEECNKTAEYIQKNLKLQKELIKVEDSRDKYFDMAWDAKTEVEATKKRLSEVSSKLSDKEIQLINSRNKITKLQERIIMLENTIQEMKEKGEPTL